ncbi:hypothetical protein DSO57_1003643 [Entomophthora muscae]|uniref:Uncharacterized protein n=1 Tax=Entomophthora muscae TaxID=34485 RepID=A0ACC2SL88_9FUNG|nr:hypothetical protein DSO57_1003643 [Entomophthora muscae]
MHLVTSRLQSATPTNIVAPSNLVSKASEQPCADHQMLVCFDSHRWNVLQEDGYPACVIDCEPGRSLARLLNADDALVARIEKKRILSSTYHINLAIGRGAETISKATLTCRAERATGVLSVFQIKIRHRASGSVTLFRWICISSNEWWLVQCDSDEPLDMRSLNIIGQFLSNGTNSGILSFRRLACPAHASIFTITIAYLKSNHINLLDALSLTSRNLNII